MIAAARPRSARCAPGLLCLALALALGSRWCAPPALAQPAPSDPPAPQAEPAPSPKQGPDAEPAPAEEPSPPGPDGEPTAPSPADDEPSQLGNPPAPLPEAQPSPIRGAARRAQGHTVPLGQALDDGYAPRPGNEPAGSLLGGLLAVGPGFIVHGIGHYYAGDRGTALKLLLTELVGLALILTSELMSGSDVPGGLAGGRQIMTHAGVLLFLGSWAADIVGAFKGAAPFDEDSTRQEGTRFGLAYRYTSDPFTPFRHHVVGRFNIDLGFLYIRPLVDLEAQMATRRYELEVGWRTFRGRNSHNALGIGARGRRIETPEHGLGTVGLAGYIELKTDMGQLMRTLSGLYFVNRTGYGVERWRFADRAGTVPSISGGGPYYDDTYLLIESGFGVNTNPKTRVQMLFIQDPTRDIAPVTRRTGLIEADLTHRYREDLDIQARFLLGDGWALWLGLEYGL